MSKIAAGIVLYNPDINELNENIKNIIGQIDFLVLIDNNSEKNLIDSVVNIYKQCDNIFFIFNNENKGIAHALNQIVKFCELRNVEWVLTLDQDSSCPTNLIETYKKYIHIPSIGIITPAIIDKNLMYDGEKSEEKFKYVDLCLTSAALTNVKICKKVGYFDEKMFIDFVDFDYCYTLMENGYKIIKTFEVSLLHQLGNLTQKKFMNIKINVSNHTSSRKYYYIRNAIYCYRKHNKIMKFRQLSATIAKTYFKVILFESDKVNKILKLNQGMSDGIRMDS